MTTWQPIRLLCKGMGAVSLKDGRIVGVNFFRDMIDLISQIPAIQENLDQHMPAKYKQKLQQADTIIKSAQTEVRLEKDKVFFTDLLLDAEGFFLKANGSLNWSQQLEFRGDFYFPKDLSDLMVSGAPEFSHFLDDKGFVQFPLEPYLGPAASFRPTLDLKKIGQIAVKIGKTHLKKIITNALDLEEEKIIGVDDSSSNLDQAQESLPPEKELLKSLIDTVIDKF